MGDFVFNDRIRSAHAEYLLKTSNVSFECRLVSSVFRDGELVSSREKTYDAGLGSEELLSLTRSFHEENKSEIDTLLKLSQHLAKAKNPVVKNLLGMAFLKRGMYEEAITEFEGAIRLDKDLSSAYNNLGKAYMLTGNADRAVRTLETLVNTNGSYPDFFHTLGMAYQQCSRCRKALEQFERALQINPYYAEAHLNIAITLVMNLVRKEDYKLSVDSPERISKSLERATELNPSYRTLELKRAQESLEAKKYDDAYDALVKLREEAKDSVDTTFILDFYLKILYDDASVTSATIWRHIRRLQSLIKQHPNFPDLFNHLGVAYVIFGKFLNRKALENFDRALQINPKFERAKKNKKLAEYDRKGIELLFDAILKNGA
jgi:tetratricopeptide (TPR) repeat protein